MMFIGILYFYLYSHKVLISVHDMKSCCFRPASILDSIFAAVNQTLQSLPHTSYTSLNASILAGVNISRSDPGQRQTSSRSDTVPWSGHQTRCIKNMTWDLGWVGVFIDTHVLSTTCFIYQRKQSESLTSFLYINFKPLKAKPYFYLGNRFS